MLNSVLLTSANVLYIFCYGVRDVLWLRILAVAAMFLLLPFYLNQVEPLISCVLWQLVFIAINLYWIIVIIRERQPPTMNETEKQLYDTVFRDCCSPRDMLRLVAAADWKQANEGDCLIQRKTILDQLLLIYSGAVSVEVNGAVVANLSPGNLVGEMSFLTQNKTTADIIAQGPTRYLTWKRESLERLFREKAELKSAIHEMIGRDLVQKLTPSDEQDSLILASQI